MDLELTGKVAVVTGASAGVGLAVVAALADEGAYVVAGARRSSPALDELIERGRVELVAIDLAHPDAPAELITRTGERVDILVNSVGESLPRAGLAHIHENDWLESFNLNFFAAVRATKAALPAMFAAGGGSIVNVASVNAWRPDPAIIDYGAAKAALWSFGKALSKEVAPRGVRVNTVAPGPTDTDMLSADAESAAGNRLAGRLTRPAQIADLVALLASDRSANTTGATFTVDGGVVGTL